MGEAIGTEEALHAHRQDREREPAVQRASLRCRTEMCVWPLTLASSGSFIACALTLRHSCMSAHCCEHRVV